MLHDVELPGPLVSADWLRALTGDPGLVIADLRWVREVPAREAFEAGHVRGAVFFDVDLDLAASPGEGRGRHPLPSPEAFAATMSAAGIGDGTAVVAYDVEGGSLAARLWWMLDVTGHEAAVLDGGLRAWGGPIETGPPTRREPAAFTARPWPADRIVDVDGVTAALRDGSATVLEARAAARYRGEVEPLYAVAGHIPGARSSPWEENLDPETGRFLPPERLREKYLAAGVGERDEAICQCGSGVTACHDVLAMELAGLQRPKLYVGSWSDWISDPSRPVATGPKLGSL